MSINHVINLYTRFRAAINVIDVETNSCNNQTIITFTKSQYVFKLVIRDGNMQMLEAMSGGGYQITPVSEYHLALFKGKVRNAEGYMVWPHELTAAAPEPVAAPVVEDEIPEPPRVSDIMTLREAHKISFRERPYPDDEGWMVYPQSAHRDGLGVLPKASQILYYSGAGAYWSDHGNSGLAIEGSKIENCTYRIPMAAYEQLVLFKKMTRDSGLCVSAAHNDVINALRAKFILSTYVEWYYGTNYSNYMMESAHRATNNWSRVDNLPTEFNATVYRLVEV